MFEFSYFKVLISVPSKLTVYILGMGLVTNLKPGMYLVILY